MQSMLRCFRTLATALPIVSDSTLAQSRQYKTVVVNNNCTKAVRLLNTHIKEEKLMDKWRAKTMYVKPSHQRVIKQKETEKRLNRQKFKNMMYWVMQAKSRGFWDGIYALQHSHHAAIAGAHSKICTQVIYNCMCQCCKQFTMWSLGFRPWSACHVSHIDLLHVTWDMLH